MQEGDMLMEIRRFQAARELHESVDDVQLRVQEG
jgi:hypothetical protein